MIFPGKIRLIFRIVSAVIAGIFLWQQVAWAGGGELGEKLNTVNTQANSMTASTLTDQQSTAQALISAKQAIEDSGSSQGSTALASDSLQPVIAAANNAVQSSPYTYYVSGRMESVTLTTPDQWGNVYYHYIDENFNSQGYGRVDKEILANADSQGAIAYQYEFFSSSVDQRQIRRGYSDTGFKNLINTYTYQLNGDFLYTVYYANTTTRFQEAFFKKDWLWQYTVEYASDGATLHQKWINDSNPNAAGDVTSQNYDSQGRLSLEYLDDGSAHGISYYSTTANKYQEYFCKPNWAWQWSIEYYEDGVTKKLESMVDPNLLQTGDIVHVDYDSRGRVVSQQFDDTSIVQTNYWGDTSNIYEKYVFGSNWTWQYSIRYFEDGNTTNFLWIASDYADHFNGDIHREYYSNGLIKIRQVVNGDITYTDYYSGTTNKTYDAFFDSNWGWKNSVEYYEDGTIKVRSFADPDPSKAGDIIRYEYDTLGRTTLTTYDDQSFYGYSYYANTNNVYQKWFALANWNWQYTIEYFEDGTTIHYKWIKDVNPSSPGDETSQDYDNQGRLTQRYFDDQSTIVYSYWGATSNIYEKYVFGSNWTWQYSIRYFEDGNTTNFLWIASDYADHFNGDIHREYYSNGLIKIRQVVNGDITYTDYYSGTTNKTYDAFFDSNWGWKNSVEYYEDGTIKVRSFADPDPSKAGDIIRYEYDTLGRTTLTTYDDQSFYGYSYYANTNNVYQKWFALANWNWQYTIEYFEDGTTVHKQWFADKHPATTGDVVYIEHDADGIPSTKMFDNNTVVYDTSTQYYTMQNISGTMQTGKDTYGQIATFKYINGKWLINSVEWQSSLIYWNYDANGNAQGYIKILSNGTIKKYDATNKLIETDTSSANFATGANLPWINYGSDIGSATGFANDLATLYSDLDQWKGSTVRVFLFCDLRSGITFDASGNPISFNGSAFNDMQALLDVAKAFDIKLIPVLFDYMIADGKSGTYLGEHSDLITDASKKQKLLDLFSTFFDRFAGDSSIYAWDVMNEPEFAGAVSIDDAHSFVSDFVKLIHSKSDNALVTLGSARRDWMVKYWTDIGLDVYQFHYYDSMESSTPLNDPVSQLNLDKPVIAGELQPDSVSSKLSTLSSDGYAGGLFWQDQGTYKINTSDYTTIRSFFYGIKSTYSYYTSGRIKDEFMSNGIMREFEDLAFYKNGTGRLTKQIFSDNSYITYEYRDNTTTFKTVTSFSATAVPIMKKDYDSTGAVVTITIYYDNGRVRKASNSDGSYQSFDQSGNLIEQAVKINGTLTIRDTKLLREILADGTIKEYSFTGSLLRILKTDGTSIEYYYNADSSILSRYEYSANGSFTAYDGLGNTVYTYTYKAADMQAEQPDANALSITTALEDIITYENSVVQSITRKSDGSIITNIELDGSGKLKNAHIIHTDGSVDIVYNNSVIETLLPDGTISRYRDNRKVFDYSKVMGYTRYYYTLDGSNNITSVTVVNKNATCTYDANGLPVRFEKTDGSITEYDNGYLKRITDSDGRQYLYTIVTGSNPSSTITATVTSNTIPAKVLYDASKNITSVTLGDGTILSSANGTLQGIAGLGGKIDVATGGAFSFDDGSYKAYYDAKGNLVKISTQDNTDVYFNNGQISEVDAEDGTRVLYTGGKISQLYDKQEGATYESDSLGRVTRVTYDNGAVFKYDYIPILDDVTKVIITKEDDPSNVTVRFYDKDGLLTEQNLPSGVISKYIYETSGARRILSVTQTKNGAVIGSYTYDYSQPNKTLVTDMNHNIREYDTAGNIKFMYTPEGYVYQYTLTSDNTLVSELIRWDKGNGVTIYYNNGNVDRVETISGGNKTVLTSPVFDANGNLRSFTVILPSGQSRSCTVYDNGWTTIVTPDGTKLIYKDDPTTGNGHLVAVNSDHRLFMFDTSLKVPSSIPVDITKDPSALDHIDLVQGDMTDYTRQMLLKQYGVIKEDPVPATLVPGNRTWQPQSNDSSTLGISSVSSGSDMITMQANISSASGHNQGEAFLDLTIDNIGHTVSAPYNFTNDTLSFYVKLQDGTLPAGGSLTVQAFAKDANWNSEYSTQVTITQAGVWCKIDLKISGDTPIFGLKDGSFNPAMIRLVGLRIVSTSANLTYNGQIYLKDANHQTLSPTDKLIDFPFFVNKDSVEPYVGSIPDDQPVVGNPNYISWADIPTILLPSSTSNNNGQIDLNKASGRAQTYADSLGVQSVTRDDTNNQWVLNLNLQSGSTTNNDGEMYVDLRYDIPGYTWTGPLDLTGKTLTFKIKAPAGFIAASNSANNPMWAQVFVKDENYNYQYGPNVQITQEGQWLTVTLTPQIGEIIPGNSKTSPDFDPTKIVNIGVKISCNKDSVSSYQGQFYVQNATSPDILNKTTAVYLLDMNALKNYASSKNINVTYEDFLGAQIKLAKDSLPTYFKDSSVSMATEYYPDGSVKRVLKGNSRVEYYNTDGRLIKITDTNDETLVEYTYNSNGDLTEIDYSGTRDSIRKSMDDARTQAQQQANDTIKQIAEAKGYAVQYVHDTIQPALDTAYATKANLQAQWSDWNGRSYHWWQWSEKGEKKQVMHSLENAIGQVDQAISSLLAKAAEMYANIDANINKAKQDIQTQLDASLQAIAIQENTAIAETMKQEVIEVIDVYYKEALGRSASTDEINSWLAKAQAEGCLDPINRKAFDVSLVKTELATNQAYIDEALANNTFISDVNAAVVAYLLGFASIADKNAALASYLGLSVSDINYSASDFEAIIKWLSSNNKHFGKSAFTALAEILKNNGKTLSVQDLEELATKVILIDIFSGSITSITTGELEISMFALSKYASTKYSTTLYDTDLNNKTLVALQDAISGGKEAIVRVSGDHFIVVTSIAADGTVSYLEGSRGKLGEVMTMKKSDFLANWDGYAITQKTPLQDNISKVLSAAEARLIRGSEPTIIAVLAIISLICAVTSTILSFIDNEICQMLSKVFAIVSLVTGVLSIALNFGNIIKSFATGLQNIDNALKTSTIWLGEMFKHGIEGFVSGMANILSKAVSGICLNLSYNKALTTFGLNSDLAGITSAFLSGGFAGVNSTFSLTGAFSSLTIEGVRYAGKELGLDPTITSIIGMSAATIVSAGLGGVTYYDKIEHCPVYLTGLDAISYTIGTTVLPNVASELAYYGITKLGEAIGIDPIISQIAGIGIRSTISAGLRGYDSNNIFQGVMGGLVQGVASIGINYATQEFGLNPLFANLGFSAIASAINAGIQASTGGSQDVFKTFFDTYINNALTFLGYGNITDPNYAWLEASYKSSIIDFSNKVRDEGLVEALNTYGVSFFNSTIVGAIAQSGMTIGKYFDDKLSQGQSTDRTLPNKQVVKQVPVQDAQGNTVANVFFVQKQNGATFYWDVVGVEYLTQNGTYLDYGSLGVDSYAKLGFTDAELYSTFNADMQFQRIENGEQVYAELKDSQGNTLLVIEPTENGGYNFYNNYGDYIDAKIREFSLGYDISIKNSMLGKYLLNSSNWLDDEQRDELKNAGYTDSDIDRLMLKVGFDIDSSGKPVLQYGLTADAQMLTDVTRILGSQWLTELKLDGDIFYSVSSYLLDTTSYSKNTRTLADVAKGIAAIDMLNLDIKYENYVKYLLPLMALFLRVGYDNTVWDMSVRDAAPEVTKAIDTLGMKFVYVPGNTTAINNLSDVEKMRDLLGSDKKVVVGWSAGTEAVIKSWATTKDKDVYYILVSPRMTPETLQSYAMAAGIDPNKILIVNAARDAFSWGAGYGDNAAYEQSWNYVYLAKDTTTPNYPLIRHDGPILGWLNNHSYDLIINDNDESDDTPLIDIFKRFLNGTIR